MCLTQNREKEILMDILIEKVSDKSLILIKFLKIFNKKIYYLKIVSKDEKKLFYKLKSLNVFPLPIDEIKNIPSNLFADLDFDPNNLILKKTNSIYSKTISKFFLKNFFNYSEVISKLLIKDTIRTPFTTLNTYIKIWLNKNNHLLFITSDIKNLFLIEKNKNLNLIYIPTDFISFFLNIFLKLKSFLIIKLMNLKFNSPKFKNEKNKNINPSKVAFILHGETYYGSTRKKILYDKDLYYSNFYKNFKKKNIQHFGYLRKNLYDKSLKYKFLSNNNLSFKDILTINYFFFKSIFFVRRASHLFLIYILLKDLKSFLNYKNIFTQYPDLKLALIDYDFLCPKSIILALMSIGVKTACTQERFIGIFYNSWNVLIDDYFTPSKYTNKIIKKNKSIFAKNLIPVGLYRSDKFLKKFKKKNSKKVIVALGYHTVNLLDSKTDLLINWKTSKQFLEDMYRLSKEIKNCKIIIRLKNMDEYKNPYFKEIIKKIKLKKNIKIDTSDAIEHSYKICSNADLVIARHTSLADECISYNIPVIFYDYTHNMKRIYDGAFHYNNSMICKSYSDVLKNTKEFLNNKNSNFKNQFKNIKKKYYFFDRNMKVKDKIINYLNAYLMRSN